MAGALGVEHARTEVAHVDAGAEAATRSGQHDGVDLGVGPQLGAGLAEFGRP